jgi:hypothetical protein
MAYPRRPTHDEHIADQKKARDYVLSLVDSDDDKDIERLKRFVRDIAENESGFRGSFFLRAMPYQDYLKTAHWECKRWAAVEQAKHRCSLCNADGELHVHHRTYERRGEEREDDLVCLCASCHKMFHQNSKADGQ